jgi:hypothetical protein
VLVQAIRTGSETEEPVDTTPVEPGAYVDTAPSLHADAEPTEEMAYPAPVEAVEDEANAGNE